jgi:hypothetical protein
MLVREVAMTTCSKCFDRQGVIVPTEDGPRLARCPACGGAAISARAAEATAAEATGANRAPGPAAAPSAAAATINS